MSNKENKADTQAHSFKDELSELSELVMNGSDFKKITIKQYCDFFNITYEKPDALREILGSIYKNDCFFEFLGVSKTIDAFLNYEIPEKLKDMTQQEIQNCKETLLNYYTQLYNNPQLIKKKINTPGRILRRFINNLYDATVFLISFGTLTVIREPEENVYRRIITKAYQATREYHIKENTPECAKGMLDIYLSDIAVKQGLKKISEQVVNLKNKEEPK